MQPSNATARARSSNRPNNPISGAIAGKSARNELRTPARLFCRGFREPGGEIGHRAAPRFEPFAEPGMFRSVHRDGRCRRAAEFVDLRPPAPSTQNRIGAEIAPDFPDLWGRLFEHGAVICLDMPWPFPDPCVGAERHAAMGCRTRAGHPICDRTTPLAFSLAHWNRLKFPNKPPLR